MRPAHRRAFKYFYCEVSDIKKAASIFLRAEIDRQDLELMIRWMDNPNITRYLNEAPPHRFHPAAAVHECACSDVDIPF